MKLPDLAQCKTASASKGVRLLHNSTTTSATTQQLNKKKSGIWGAFNIKSKHFHEHWKGQTKRTQMAKWSRSSKKMQTWCKISRECEGREEKAYWDGIKSEEVKNSDLERSYIIRNDFSVCFRLSNLGSATEEKGNMCHSVEVVKFKVLSLCPYYTCIKLPFHDSVKRNLLVKKKSKNTSLISV